MINEGIPNALTLAANGTNGNEMCKPLNESIHVLLYCDAYTLFTTENTLANAEMASKHKCLQFRGF